MTLFRPNFAPSPLVGYISAKEEEASLAIKGNELELLSFPSERRRNQLFLFCPVLFLVFVSPPPRLLPLRFLNAPHVPPLLREERKEEGGSLHSAGFAREKRETVLYGC